VRDSAPSIARVALTSVNSIYTLDPLVDQRWNDLVAHHGEASAFHQRGWLEALSRTYGYQPLVLTSSPPGRPLDNGIVLCRVSSWITGTRLVSLPFSDHCDALLDDISGYHEFIDWLRGECDRQQYKYVELRPLFRCQEMCGLQPSHSYCFHELDIRPTLEHLFRGLQKDSIQRKIRRAEREQLSYEAGRSEQLMDDFFRLFVITRRRHQLPPPPRVWFRNLLECMGDNIEVRVARKNGYPIGAVLTLRHRSAVMYKYGCSDDRFHNLVAMPFLIWRLIEESKASKVEKIDFGRSDSDNEGLIGFKDRFGTTRRLLTYYRHPTTKKEHKASNRSLQAIRQSLSFVPDSILARAGKVLYRHIG